MAVTKIIPIRVALQNSVDYICTPNKTDDRLLVHSERCYPNTAGLEFQHYLRQTQAGGNTIGRTLIQSFAPGEVTPEQAHEIGKKLAAEILVKVENVAFRQAVEVVTGATPPTAASRPSEAEPLPKKLILPEASGVPLRLYDYLCMKRGIDGDVVNTLIQEEKLYEDRRGNVVFVGHDERGATRFASLRGTQSDFRGDCSGSDKRYGFHAVFAPCERVYVFESPIDLMPRKPCKRRYGRYGRMETA